MGQFKKIGLYDKSMDFFFCIVETGYFCRFNTSLQNAIIFFFICFILMNVIYIMTP